MTGRPSAPATERNREAIRDVLRAEFETVKSVLEIGSGTGQHAVFLGQEFPWLTWQTSDREENHAGINAWIDEVAPENVRRPLQLDVETVDGLNDIYDAVFSANTAHIMSTAAVKCMFRLAGSCLAPSGSFCLYGPFNVNGEFTSESNKAFDASLKARDDRMGIRDLADLHALARASDLSHERLYAMPANNMLVVWRKS